MLIVSLVNNFKQEINSWHLMNILFRDQSDILFIKVVKIGTYKLFYYIMSLILPSCKL